MADDVLPSGATNIGLDDKGGVLHQKEVPYDVDTMRAQGSTFYREFLTSAAYSVLYDSMANGLGPIWTSTTSGGGAITNTTGEIILSTGAAANGTAQLVSYAPIYLPGQQHWFRSALRWGDLGVANSIARAGAFTVNGTTPQDGFAFEENGTSFNFVVYKGGVATTTALASWNNIAEKPLTLDLNIGLWEIRWTANQAMVYQGNELRHVTPASAVPITNTLDLPMCYQIINGTNATNRVLGVRNTGLGRFGIPPEGDHDNYFRGRGATYRMPGRAGTANRRLLALWNAIGSGRVVHVDQITIDVMMTAVMAVTVIPPIIRVHRITAIPTNGNAMTKVAKDVGGVSVAGVSLFQDASADGTNSTTALAVTAPTAGTHLTQEWQPRLITAAGYEMADRIELLDDKDVIIRPGEGVVLSYEGITAATQEPATTHTIATIDWRESFK